MTSRKIRSTKDRKNPGTKRNNKPIRLEPNYAALSRSASPAHREHAAAPRPPLYAVEQVSAAQLLHDDVETALRLEDLLRLQHRAILRESKNTI